MVAQGYSVGWNQLVLGVTVFFRNFFELVLCDGCRFEVISAVGQLCFFDHFCFLIMISALSLMYLFTMVMYPNIEL